MATLVPAEETSKGARLVPADESKSSGININALGGVLSDYNSLPKTLSLYGDVGKQLLMGVGDFAVGAGQLVSNIAGRGDRYGEAMKFLENEYQNSRGEFAGRVEPARIGSNLITGLATAGGAPISTGLLGRMGAGAKSGFVTGLAAPVDPNIDNYGTVKGLQTDASTAMGGLAVPAVEGLVKGAGFITNAIGNAIKGLSNTVTGQASVSTIENKLITEFEKSGVAWDKLSKAYRDNLIAETQNAIKAGGKLDPQAAQRLADFQRIGADPLAGQVTRNPYQFANEQNLARMEVGAPLAQRLGQQQQRFGQVLDDIRPNTGDAYSAGQKITGTLEAKDAAMKGVVDAAYKGARDSSGRAATLDVQAFSKAANDALDSQMLGAYLPGEVRIILNDVSSGKIPFNVNTAVQIDSLLSKAQRTAGNGSPQSLAIGQVRDALNKSPISSQAGVETKAAFDKARGLALNRFQAQEASPALKAVTSGEAPAAEDFVSKFVIRADIAETAKNLRAMGPEARVEARGAVIDWIKSQSVNGEKFSPAGLKRALENIGDRKLNLIFAGDREGLATLQALRRASYNAITPPVASGVNYSGSATTAMDALDKISRIPVLGAFLPKGGDLVRSSSVTSSMNAPALAQPGSPILNPDLVGQFGRFSGLLAAPAAGLPVYGLLAPK